MMPFSVLRTWGLGVVNWGLLAAGIYCLVEWANQPTAAEIAAAERVVAPDRPENKSGNNSPTVARSDAALANNWPDPAINWEYLAWGLGLISLSSFGYWPLVLLLGKPSGVAPPRVEPRESLRIKRPDGSELHVELHGRSAGTTIVFTHGWSLDRTAWNYLVKELGDQFRLVVWDLPGLGKSRGSAEHDYRLEKMAADLYEVIETTARKNHVVLLGHSIGGMINQTFARQYPEQLGNEVQGIALVHSTYTNPLKTAWLAPMWRALEKPLIVPLNYLTIALAPLAWLSNWQSYLNGSLHVATRIASFSGRQTLGELNYGAYMAAKAWPGVIALGNLAMLEFDELDTLQKIDIPMLVVVAEHDRMTKPEAGEVIERALPQGRLAVLDAGHLGIWERHHELADLLAEFAELHDSKRPSAAQSPIADASRSKM